MTAIRLTKKQKEIANYFLKHDRATIYHIARRKNVSVSTVSKSMNAYFNYQDDLLKKVKSIMWDINELQGELNPDHDFRKLIKYE